MCSSFGMWIRRGRFSLRSFTPCLQHCYNSPFVQRRFLNLRKELKEIRCCDGCGVQLQFQNEGDYGYIPKETLIHNIEAGQKSICQRCHRVGLRDFSYSSCDTMGL